MANKNLNKKNENAEEIVSLMRYTTLGELIKMIRLGGIPLYNTERWEDRCDAAFVERGVREMNKPKTVERYGVMCFMGQTRKEKEEEKKEEEKEKEADDKIQYSYSPSETIHHWKCYANGKERAGEGVGIKIGFNPCALLNEFLQKNYDDKNSLTKDLEKSDVLSKKGRIFGKMKYGTISEIQERLKEGKSENFFFTKRNAFKDEREYRLVQYKEEAEPICEHCQNWMRVLGISGFIPVDDWEKWIDRIVFSPFSDKELIEKLRQESETKEKFGLTSEEAKTFQQLISSNGKKSYRSGILDNKRLLNLASNKSKNKENKKKGKSK
ncbi:hypothetical protein SAMN05720469_10635 [Fibrobacter intestinalis]|uniref:DUF2971 domain-containing protein n=1 Tax=Fibrobacter intestinalis TaxID=28122 RepID=A0A1M6SEW4_9BACT|nr:hypothetical protein [Fibrobacter intestinalis]SHK43225.1 hypothetical protein SAMN05720469_10635 [Fibrobacter intestinalis]